MSDTVGLYGSFLCYIDDIYYQYQRKNKKVGGVL